MEIANIAGYWWQQLWCNCTYSMARTTMQPITVMFQDRIISQNSDFPSSPRSPDLTAPYFFLWEYL